MTNDNEQLYKGGGNIGKGPDKSQITDPYKKVEKR